MPREANKTKTCINFCRSSASLRTNLSHVQMPVSRRTRRGFYSDTIIDRVKSNPRDCSKHTTQNNNNPRRTDHTQDVHRPFWTKQKRPGLIVNTRYTYQPEHWHGTTTDPACAAATSTWGIAGDRDDTGDGARSRPGACASRQRRKLRCVRGVSPFSSRSFTAVYTPAPASAPSVGASR